MRYCSLLLTLSLLPHRIAAQGRLALFLDFYCKTPSQIAPSASLPLSTCLVPIGAVSVAISQLPACDSGTASMIMYQDTSCARDTLSISNTYTGWSDINNCFYLYVSKSIPGIMFTCDPPATDPQPTATSTLTASIIAGVATGAPKAATSATTQHGTESPTLAPNSTVSTSSPPTSTGKSGVFSGLSTSDRIALGVGLGVGIPTILIGLVAWCWPRLWV